MSQNMASWFINVIVFCPFFNSTINSNFGSHVVTSSGIILNNEMYDFDLPSAAGGSDVYTVSNQCVCVCVCVYVCGL